MLSSYIFIILPFIVLVAGLLTFKKYKNTYLKYFLFFIFFVVLNESLAYYVGYVLRKSTYLIYNIYLLISTIFYLSLFKFYIKRNKFYIKLLLLIFIFSYFFNYFFIQNSLTASQTYSILIASIVIVTSVVFLLVELLNNDDILTINKLLLFWISIGVLLFYVGIVPIFVMGEFLNFRGLFDYIILALNIIMYGCFITGFIVSKKEVNT